MATPWQAANVEKPANFRFAGFLRFEERCIINQ
jgi:hypothetical protein